MGSCGNYNGVECVFFCVIGYCLIGLIVIRCIVYGNRFLGFWNKLWLFCEGKVKFSK